MITDRAEAIRIIKTRGPVYGVLMGKNDVREVQLVKSDLLLEIERDPDFFDEHCVIVSPNGDKRIDSAP